MIFFEEETRFDFLCNGWTWCSSFVVNVCIFVRPRGRSVGNISETITCIFILPTQSAISEFYLSDSLNKLGRSCDKLMWHDNREISTNHSFPNDMMSAGLTGSLLSSTPFSLCFWDRTFSRLSIYTFSIMEILLKIKKNHGMWTHLTSTQRGKHLFRPELCDMEVQRASF